MVIEIIKTRDEEEREREREANEYKTYINIILYNWMIYRILVGLLQLKQQQQLIQNAKEKRDM